MRYLDRTKETHMKKITTLMMVLPAVVVITIGFETFTEKVAVASYQNQYAQLDLWGGFWQFFKRQPYDKWHSASGGCEG